MIWAIIYLYRVSPLVFMGGIQDYNKYCEIEKEVECRLQLIQLEKNMP